MPNLNLPTNINPGVTATFEADVEAAWTELNRLSRDTGWRDVTSLIPAGWTAGSVRVRRVEDRVYWGFLDLDGSAATSTQLMNLTPALWWPFRPQRTYESSVFRNFTGTFTGYFRVATTTLLAPVGYRGPSSTVIEFDYPCYSSWPTELPGTAIEW